MKKDNLIFNLLEKNSEICFNENNVFKKININENSEVENIKFLNCEELNIFNIEDSVLNFFNIKTKQLNLNNSIIDLNLLKSEIKNLSLINSQIKFCLYDFYTNDTEVFNINIENIEIEPNFESFLGERYAWNNSIREEFGLFKIDNQKKVNNILSKDQINCLKSKIGDNIKHKFYIYDFSKNNNIFIDGFVKIEDLRFSLLGTLYPDIVQINEIHRINKKENDIGYELLEIDINNSNECKNTNVIDNFYIKNDKKYVKIKKWDFLTIEKEHLKTHIN